MGNGPFQKICQVVEDSEKRKITAYLIVKNECKKNFCGYASRKDSFMAHYVFEVSFNSVLLYFKLINLVQFCRELAKIITVTCP